MPSPKVVGVILAAGKGARMYPFSERLPKSLLPVGNRPLLEFQLEQMARFSIKKVIVVVGYYGFEIVRRIGDGSRWELEIEYVDQERTLGIAHALGCLEKYIDSPLLLFLGDILFTAPDLNGMLSPIEAGKAHCVLAAKRETDAEAVRRNFSICQRPDGSVESVIEKPHYSVSTLKGCGLYAFDQQIFDAVRRTPRTAARDEYEITDSIQLMIDAGQRVEVMDGIIDDINLTYPEDVLRANQLELRRYGRERLIGERFQGPPETKIHRAVIGDDVSLPRGIQVEDAVIFSGVTVTDDKPLRRVIVTRDQTVTVDSVSRR